MDTIKNAYLYGIQNEIKTKNLYTLLQKAFLKAQVGNIFKELIELEKIHEKKLTEQYMKLFPGEKPDVDHEEIFTFHSEIDLKDANDVLQFAIAMEQQAHEKYTQLATDTEDEETRALFSYLAGEENNHKELLQDEIERIHGAMTWFDPSELNGLQEY